MKALRLGFEKLLNFVWGVPTGFVLVDVVSVQSTGTEELVYDMTTADHEFVANGLLIHNCHQAVTQIDKYRGFEEQGHGSHWKAWMVRVGLDPRRFDPQPNSTYMSPTEKREHEDKLAQQKKAQEKTNEILREENLQRLNPYTLKLGMPCHALIKGELVMCRVLLDITHKGSAYYIVFTYHNLRARKTGESSTYSFVKPTDLYSINDPSQMMNSDWDYHVLQVAKYFIGKYYKGYAAVSKLSQLDRDMGVATPAPAAPVEPLKPIPYLDYQLKPGTPVEILDENGNAVNRPGRVLIRTPDDYWLLMEPFHFNKVRAGEPTKFTKLLARSLGPLGYKAHVTTSEWDQAVYESCVKLIDEYYAGDRAAIMKNNLKAQIGLEAYDRIGEGNNPAPVPFAVSAEAGQLIADTIFGLLQKFPLVKKAYKGWTADESNAVSFNKETGKINIPRSRLENRTLLEADRKAIVHTVTQGFGFALDQAVIASLNPANQGAWHLAKSGARSKAKFVTKTASDYPARWFSEQFTTEMLYLHDGNRETPVQDLIKSFSGNFQ